MKSWQSPHGRPLPVIGGRTLIMAVLNVTPDSFSDGGQLGSEGDVVARAKECVAQGADVLDIGGESTRPGAAPVSLEQELSRVVPAIRAIRSALPDVPISVDTYKAAVAEQAVHAGADIINDVWGLTHALSGDERVAWRERARDGGTPIGGPPPIPEMARTAAHLHAPVVLMHNRPNRDYASFWDDLLLDLQMSLTIARVAGIERSQLWLDPGFGFAKTVAHNLEVLRLLHRVVALGYPVLVGTSRKSTLGAVLGTTVENRIEGSGASIVWAIQQGCAMVRVHDVAAMSRFARMADAIKAGMRFTPA